MKIDKRILVILIIIIVILLVAGYFAYQYLKEVNERAKEGQTPETQEKQDAAPEEENKPLDFTPQIEIEPQPGLTICLDECGNGICQPIDPECADSLNCPCAETPQDCPQDCQ